MSSKAEWTEAIKRACEDAGTYQPYFDIVIDQLAGIMETKDEATRQYEESGNQPVVKFVNKGGSPYLRRNPALDVMKDCNTQALAYWRDLGLTPSGLKKLNADALTAKATADGFEQLLAKIGQ